MKTSNLKTSNNNNLSTTAINPTFNISVSFKKKNFSNPTVVGSNDSIGNNEINNISISGNNNNSMNYQNSHVKRRSNSSLGIEGKFSAENSGLDDDSYNNNQTNSKNLRLPHLPKLSRLGSKAKIQPKASSNPSTPKAMEKVLESTTKPNDKIITSSAENILTDALNQRLDITADANNPSISSQALLSLYNNISTLNNLNGGVFLPEISQDTLKKLELLSDKHFKAKLPSFSAVMAKGNALDDLVLKKALKTAFESGHDSYLGALQEVADKADSSITCLIQMIPPSKIPKDYFIFSNSPIYEGLVRGGDFDYNEKNHYWEKLVFPSTNPSRRVEVFLLAKAMDDMLLRTKREEKSVQPTTQEGYYKLILENMSKSYTVHLNALFEISRQVFVSCLERGILVQKIYNYFKEFFDISMTLLGGERKKGVELQGIISQYETLMHDFQKEKNVLKEQIEELAKANQTLRVENEDLQKKIALQPKYELVLRLLQNKKKWEAFMNENGISYEERDDLFGDLDLNQLKQNVGRKPKKSPKKENPVRQSSEINTVNSAYPSDDFLRTQQEKGNIRMMKLIWTNLKDSINQIMNLSDHFAKLLERDKKLQTKINTDMLNVTEVDSTTPQGILNVIYDINSRLSELNGIAEKQDKIRESRSFCERSTQYEDRLIRIELVPMDKQGKIKALFFDAVDDTPISFDTDYRLQNKDRNARLLEESVKKLKAQLEYEKKENQRLREEIYERDEIIETTKHQMEEQKSIFLNRFKRQEKSMADLHKSINHLEQGVQLKPIKVILNVMGEGYVTREGFTREMQDDDVITSNRVYNKVAKPILVSNTSKPVVDPISNNSKTTEKINVKQTVANTSNNSNKVNPASISTSSNQTNKPVVSVKDVDSSDSKRSSISTPSSKQTRSSSTFSNNNSLNNSFNTNTPSSEKKSNNSISENKHHAITTRHVTNTDDCVDDLRDHRGDNSVRSHSSTSNHTTQKQSIYSSNRRSSTKETPTITKDKSLKETTISSNAIPSRLASTLEEDINNSRIENNVIESPKRIIVHVEDKYVQTDESAFKQTENRDNNYYIEEEEEENNKQHEKHKKDEKRVALPKNERMLNLLNRIRKKESAEKAKSLPWLVRFISNIYKSKLSSTLEQESSIPEFIFEFLKQSYGAQKLVDEYAIALLSSVRKFKKKDSRVDLFGKFLYEEWSLNVVNYCLKIWKICEDSKIGPEFGKPGDDGYTPGYVSKVRCLYILNSYKSDIAPVLDKILRSIEEKSVVSSDDEFIKAMAAAGYKMVDFNPVEQWGVDMMTAKQKLYKADFLFIVCEAINSSSLKLMIGSNPSISGEASLDLFTK
ncbi:hypothetical protein ABK040_011054 [Willaertia magna]